MLEVEDQLWELFRETGSVNYYLMLKALGKKKN